MSRALVFSIEEFSVFDGPGIRTSVFLMGCPLRCEWCHNPEGQSFSNFILRSPNGCAECGECVRRASFEGGKMRFTDDGIKNCPRGLLRYCAEELSAEELCARLSKNLDVLNASGGGVTFSGGEPTARCEFLLESLKLLEGKTHRAVQPSGFCPPDVFDSVLANCDYMLFDVKLVSDFEHKKYTGVSNAQIIRNFKALAKSGRDFVIRTPLIPTVTDTEQNLRAIAELLSENGVMRIELLPYNKMTGSKYPLAGLKYRPSFDESRKLRVGAEIFEEYGISAVLI